MKWFTASRVKLFSFFRAETRLSQNLDLVDDNSVNFDSLDFGSPLVSDSTFVLYFVSRPKKASSSTFIKAQFL